MKYLPYTVIEAAKKNDSEAIEIILRHFEGYIASKCKESYEDGHGNTRSFIDEDLRYLAEIALYAAILQFQFKTPPEDYVP